MDPRARKDKEWRDELWRTLQDVMRGDITMQAAAEGLGVHQSTVYRYLEKIRKFGRKGLRTTPQSKRGHSRKVKPDVVAAVVVAHENHPEFGSKRLADILEADGVPLARTTIRKILASKKRRGCRRATPPRTKVAERVGQILYQKPCHVLVRGVGNVTLQLIVDNRSRYGFVGVQAGAHDATEADSAVRALVDHACEKFREWSIPIEQIATRRDSQYCGIVRYVEKRKGQSLARVAYAAMINKDAERLSHKPPGFRPGSPSSRTAELTPRFVKPPDPSTTKDYPLVRAGLQYNVFQLALISPEMLGLKTPIRHVKLNNGRALNRDTCVETFRRVLLREFFQKRSDKDFGSVAELQTALDEWLYHYNHERAIHDPPHNDGTPMAVVQEYLASRKKA